MLDKKASVGAFSSSTGGPSSQKKRVSLHHMNQSGDKKKAALAKPCSKESQYSDMESDSGDSVASDILAGGGSSSLLGLAATTPKAKKVKNNLNCGSPLGFLDYNMDDDNGGPLPPPLGISLDKIWLDPKIIKTQVEVTVKKSFALNINISNVEGKLVMAKTQLIRKIFSKINEESMKKAALLVEENRIIINTDLKRQGVHSDRAVVIKEILMDMPKEMIIAAIFKYGQIVSIKKAVVEFTESSQADLLASKWSFLIEKNSVRVAKTVRDCGTWAFRNQFRVLLFTLPVRMTVYDLGTLLEKASGKTCIINCSLETGNRTHYAVVCFESDEAMESAFCTEPIFGSVKLSWARLDLVCCEQCGKFGHSALECDAEVALAFQSSKSFKKPANLDTHLQLAKLYAKKKVPIFRPVAFGGKFWIQVVSVASVSHGSHDGSGSGSLSFDASSPGGTPPPFSMVDSLLGTHLAHLEHSVELLSDQILNILLCLNNLSLVLSAPPSSVILSVGTSHPSISDSLMVDDSDLGFNMVLDVPLIQPISFSSGNDNSQLGLSSSKVLTSKIGILESKLAALDASIGLILAKLEQMCTGLGPLKDVICWHKEMNNMISIVTETKLKNGICPWIMNKFVGIRVFTSGLNFGHMGFGVAIIMNNFLARHVCKVSDIPGQFLSIKLLFKNKLSVLVLGLYAESSLAAVNESSFIILGEDFNKDGSHKSASFRKCFDLGLVNSLSGSLFGKEATWANSHGVAKIIDYVFVLSSLVNAILDCDVSGVKEYFDTNHKAVSVSMGLGGLLDAQLNTLHKQVNKNHWKYNFIKFKEDMLANAAMFHDEFYAAKMSLDLDTMWGHLRQVVCLSAKNVFKKKWFKGFNSVYNKVLSRFHKLELLVSKIVKPSHLVSHGEFASLLDTWKGIDPANASVVDSLFLSGSHFDTIHSALAKIRKSYCSSKLSESNHAKESQIKSAIDKRIESFELNKGHTMVLDHLVVGDELVLDPAPVKSKVDEIIEGWTRKRRVVLDVNDEWFCQYCSLGYVFNKAFSGVMGLIDFDKLFGVVSNLLDGKAAGLLAWVSIISKPYEWEGVLTNTHPIALIETAHKILSKILSDRISLAYSTYNVLCGDNFLVLKGMTTQSPIFAVGSVVEDALEKN
ncbi:hypothetical protein G9A89_014661 [Geosiphon pyriformis]|nr:hypothetical protein G9A89_014661 [Geosiphon pyriformis]